ncbi:MAG: stage 0 sporulation protein [Deltaproteobacteria bacterium]|nr:stage 0 sporulation protein [Deltaproteobacteria bacterium]
MPTLLCLAFVRNTVTGRTNAYNTQGETLRKGERCVIEADRGPELGVVESGTWIEERPETEFKRVLRRASAFDEQEAARNRVREPEAFRVAQERIATHRLPMKLVKAEHLLAVSKLVLYFTADGRVDFRDLVKELGVRFRCRIEMRQIGVRDASGLVGGIGPCGKELCCSQFLQKFEPITIRMAKDQNLPLNPQKVSGMCGRLMCCLKYEDDMYNEMRRELPRFGAIVRSEKGEGRVIDRNVLKQAVTIVMADGAKTECAVGSITVVAAANEASDDEAGPAGDEGRNGVGP